MSNPIRRFTFDDQEAFARLSGDRNPVHMDPVAARRTQAGGAIVHGVHGLLWTLDQAARGRSLEGLTSIDARFNRFVYVGAEAEARLTQGADGQMVAEVFAQGQAATTVKLGWGEPLQPGERPSQAPPAPLGPAPDAPAFEDMHGLHGCVSLPDEDLASRMFPALSAAIGPAAVAAMAAASGVVGMSCPGLHSLFSQLTLKRAAGAGAPGLAWRVERTDARARWVVLRVEGGGWQGEIICLARREPVQSKPMAALAQIVAPGEFAGRRALVIGGSRGLGAATAKLIAAGGGRVVLTYAHDAGEAEAVSRDINAAMGQAVCSARACDVTQDVAAALDGIGPVTHAYYFATPRIARQKRLAYDRQVLADFLAVYVDGFVAVWDALLGNRPLSVLYPSTVFLDQRPKGMTEYVMAKAAAECLCADLARKERGVWLTVPRIPKVLTDQTATSPPTPAADAVEVMLPLLRSEGAGTA
jgi:hypothetical protein